MSSAARLGCALAFVVAGCSTPPVAVTPPPQVVAPPPSRDEPTAPRGGQVLARNERLLLYQPVAGETLASIAERWLGRADRDWEIAELNRVAAARAGEPLVLPLQPLNPGGVHGATLQTVTILCYHRLGPRARRMTVTPAAFAQQMDWLARNGYRVVRLSQLEAFLDGRLRLPPRSVVLTFDDGYESFYQHALPVLQRHGFPATLFIVSDFVGAGDALSWAQLRELVDTGLIEIGAHSKTHRNLALRRAGDSESAHLQTLDAELRLPREQIERQLGVPVRHFAYPYGDANTPVLDALAGQSYRLATTVSAGGNTFYAQPLLLRRTMIYGDQDLAAFQSRLQVSRALPGP